MKKFELTTEFKMFCGIKLYRIKALFSFGNVAEGELGGCIEKEENLDQSGDAWVSGDALVCGNAVVCGDARVYGNAEVCGNARVYGNARVCGDAVVCGDARVYGNAEVCGNARVYGNARVCGDAVVCGDARVYGNAVVYGNAEVCGNADYTTIKGFGSVFRNTTFFRQKDNTIGVVCGCFYGTLEEFRNKVTETHGDTKYAKEYLMIADLMEMHFAKENLKSAAKPASEDVHQPTLMPGA